MKCIVTGSREFNDYKILEKAIKDSKFEISAILNGKNKGAEATADQYGKLNKITVIDYAADWNNLDVANCKVKVNSYNKEYNSLTGFNKNTDMVNDADCAIVLDKDFNAEDIIKKMKQKGKPVFIVGDSNERIAF